MVHEWHILQDNKKHGPYSEGQMRSFIGEGRLKKDTPVWCQEMDDWKRAADIESFKSHFAPSVVPPPFPERRGGGRKIAAVAALVILTIVVGVGIWWVYPKLTQSTQPQSSQPPQTGPAFGEAEGTLHTSKEEGVHDGDTIYVSMPLTLADQGIEDEMDPQWSQWVPVRLARLDAPEISPPENGATEAKNFIKQLIAAGGNKVYLDLDNNARSQTGQRFRDKDGNRLLAIVYVRINNQLVNVNAELLRWGEPNYPNYSWIPSYIYQYPDQYPSEFNPHGWLNPSYSYVRSQSGPALEEAEGTLYTARSDEGVYDGDTIYVSTPLKLANTAIENEISDLMWGSYFPVRLAMVVAPELGQQGSYEARNLVKELITSGGNKVYLNLDNEAMGGGKRFHDSTGNRLQAVVYVYANNKLINVNAEVVRLGRDNFNADWKGYTSDIVHSEFNPENWLNSYYPYVR